MLQLNIKTMFAEHRPFTSVRSASLTGLKLKAGQRATLQLFNMDLETQIITF